MSSLASVCGLWAMLSSMTRAAFSSCTRLTSGLTICQRLAEVKVCAERKRVILSWLMCDCNSRARPVAVVGPNEEIR